MMPEISLGILQGLTYEPTNNNGKFKMVLHYESATRANSGKSTTVTFKNCYVTATPVDVYYWTSNQLYIDSVNINGMSLGISGNWNGRKYWKTEADGTKKYKARSYTSSTISSKGITIGLTTTSVEVVLKGHNQEQSANTQVLKGTISGISQGWSNISGSPSISLTNQGNNKVTLSGKVCKAGTNNALNSCKLYYTTDGSAVDISKSKNVDITKTSEGSYTCPNIQLDECGKINAKVVCIGVKKDEISSGNKVFTTEYYSKPGNPTNLKITHNTDTNYVELEATQGINGSNNPATGVEIYYTTDGSTPTVNSTKYTAAFKVSSNTSNTRIRVAARTVGTYTGPSNTKSFYYSELTYADSNVDATSNPYEPTDLEIINTANNEYYFRLKVGQNGTNNLSKGVQIYYTLDGSDPETSQTRENISIDGSEGAIVRSDKSTISEDQIVKVTARTVGEKSTYQYSDFTSTVTKEILYYQDSKMTLSVSTFDKKLTKKSQIKIYAQATFYKHTQINLLNVVLYRSRGQENTVLTECAADINLSELNQQLQNQKDTVSIEKIFNLKNFDVEKNDQIYVAIDCEEVVGFIQRNPIVKSKSYLVESSGVMRIKQSGKWYEGQVLVKVNGKWEEATDILIKDSSGWHESV